MSKPRVDATGDGYLFQWAPEDVQLEIDGLHEARGGELRGLLTATTTRNGTRELLHQADFNLNSTRTRQEVVRSLGQRTDGDNALALDWAGFLEQLCFIARDNWRNGRPPIYLPDHQPRCGPRFLAEPYVEYGGPTILFAMGGTGKSMFALAISLSIAAGITVLSDLPTNRCKVAYLDWETDADTHHARLRAMCAGLGLPLEDGWIYYYRLSASLAESAQALRRQFIQLGIGFVVVDSLGHARGGEPESADSTLRLFNGARSLELPWLGVDHMTKNGGTDQATPFGSVYTHNAARMTWALETVEDGTEGASVIALHNRKRNNGRLMGRRAYEVVYEEEGDDLISVQYQPRQPADVPALLSKFSLTQQIAIMLKDKGPMQVSKIVAALGSEGISAKEPAVTNALERAKNRFAKADSYKPAMWGLLSNIAES